MQFDRVLDLFYTSSTANRFRPRPWESVALGVGARRWTNNREQKFYQENYRKLLDFGPWADCRLDAIDEPQIEAFKIWALKRGKNEEQQTNPGHQDYRQPLSRDAAQISPLCPA